MASTPTRQCVTCRAIKPQPEVPVCIHCGQGYCTLCRRTGKEFCCSAKELDFRRHHARYVKKAVAKGLAALTLFNKILDISAAIRALKAARPGQAEVHSVRTNLRTLVQARAAWKAAQTMADKAKKKGLWL